MRLFKSIRWFRVPNLIRVFLSGIWSGPNKCIYLTFDDGPHPEVTQWVLNVLKKHKIKATFFCVGRNIERFPDLFVKIKNEGHAVGNHTFFHEKGTKTNNLIYFKSVERTENMIGNKLFRPPFGSIKYSQKRILRNNGYKIVFWSWLSYDFDDKVSPKFILKKAQNIKNKDILVFHDSRKAQKNLTEILEPVIELLMKKKFCFDIISCE